MTPSQIEEAARNKYNAVGDNLWSQAEIFGLIWEACLELQIVANLIERVYTTPTVASQQEYDYPTSTVEIKRITFDGKKLVPITMREDDQLTGMNQATTDEGTPCYYFTWNEVIYLRPIPSAVGTLKIFSVNEPDVVSSTSALEIPVQFHMGLTDYVTATMAAKDLNFESAKWFMERWEKTKLEAKKWGRRKKRADGFATVQDDEALIAYGRS